MYNIKDRFYLTLKINNIIIPLEAVTVRSIILNSSIDLLFPTAELEFADTMRYFDENPITDGDRIEIIAGVNYSLPNKFIYRFRTFKPEVYEENHAVIYKLTCIFNAPRYINENFKGAIFGNTQTVLNSICQECGLTADLDITADSQTWYGFGQKRCIFANNIVKNSYLNNTSCYKLGLTLQGQLKLRNISNINFTSNSNLFVQGNKINSSVVSVLDKKESTRSGYFNNVSGYKSEAIEQGTDFNITHDTITLPVKSSTVNINKSLNNNLSGSVLKTFPVSSGNTHPNYYVAEYQNERIFSTFGNGLFIFTNDESKLEILDPIKYVLFDNVNGEAKLNSKLSGGYIIAAKTIFITPGSYYEKFKIIRQGYNLNVINARDKEILGLV